MKEYVVRVLQNEERYVLKEKDTSRYNNRYVAANSYFESGVATFWCKPDKVYDILHREDGPAVIHQSPTKTREYYYLDGESYGEDKERWQKELDRRNKPAPVKMTVEQIAAKLGHEVEIVKHEAISDFPETSFDLNKIMLVAKTRALKP